MHRVAALTGLWALVELVNEGEGVLHNIQDGQQGAREPQEFAEAVEAEVNQVTSQIHHLEERTKQATLKKNGGRDANYEEGTHLIRSTCSVCR